MNEFNLKTDVVRVVDLEEFLPDSLASVSVESASSSLARRPSNHCIDFVHSQTQTGPRRTASPSPCSSFASTVCRSQARCETRLLRFKAAAPCALGAFCLFEPGDVLVYTGAGYGAISSSSD